MVNIVCSIANKQLNKKYVPGPLGVHARTSHNDLITKVLGYRPSEDLEYGISETYKWISGQINNVK